MQDDAVRYDGLGWYDEPVLLEILDCPEGHLFGRYLTRCVPRVYHLFGECNLCGHYLPSR